MERLEADFVIIGSGLAGSVAAYLLSDLGDVLLISKEPPAKSNSFAAQGGIAAAIDQGDSPILHQADTLYAGVQLCDPDVVTLLTEKAPKLIRWLEELGVPFDRNSAEDFELGLEGAHSRRRILHAGGDATGRKVMETITDALKHIENLQRFQDAHITTLMKNRDGEVVGAIGQSANEDNRRFSFISRRGTILATGGAGQLFACTTNPSGATGDGVALAYKAGAMIRNMEFVQFHPTALHLENQCFLISEAVRGAGGVLVNSEGEPVMAFYPLRDLEPRDVVAREIYTRMLQGQNIFLDCTKIQHFQHEFPTIYSMCMSNGLNPAADWLPVSPAAHFMMGGIAASIDGETSVPGLFALGEAANTGVHGANRLASNSLLECMVMAFSLAEHMRTRVAEPIEKGRRYSVVETDPLKCFVPDNTICLKNVQSIMWESAGIIRDEESMKAGLEQLEALHRDYPQSQSICTAELILQSALARKESRGAHFRRDFPRIDANQNGVNTVLLKMGSPFVALI